MNGTGQSKLGRVLAVFGRNPSNGQLTFLEVFNDGANGLAFAISVTVSPDGKSVYVAGNTDHAVTVWTCDTNIGRLTFSQFLKDGVGGVDSLHFASSVAVSSDGKTVYAVGARDAAIAIFRRSTTTGLPTFQQTLKDVSVGISGSFGATVVVVAPDGRQV